MANSLTLLQVKEKIEKRNIKVDGDIRRAVNHDKRAQFHSEPNDEKRDIPYIGTFLDWISHIIDSNKFKVFEHLLTLPIETVDFTEGIFNELKKVFHAEDRFVRHQFINDDTEAEFEKYLASIGDNDFWQSKGFEAMKVAVSSIMIIDIPKKDDNIIDIDLSKPYYYLLDINRVVNVSVDDQNNMDWIIFKDPSSDDMYQVFDHVSYRTFLKDGDKITLIHEAPHDLGYCPARSFWTTSFNRRTKLQKRSPITNALGRLDKLLAKGVFKMHETLYAGFPIDVMYEQQCSYTDVDNNLCDNGYIHRQAINPQDPDNPIDIKDPCPSCGTNKSILGAGATLIAPMRGHKDDPDLIQGLNRISADVDSLEWIEKSISLDEKTITWNMIGYLNDQSKEAMNEMQVAGNYESRLNVLTDVKENFQKIHNFTINTIGKLRYGGAYIGSQINYGDKFLLHSVSKLQEGLKLSKESGMPIFEISNQQQQIMNTKYHNNPEMLSRVKILSSLEPFQTYTTDDILNMNDKFALDPIKVSIKLNFEDFINMFERDFMDIVPFMQFNDFKTKVNFIQTKLDDYAREFNRRATDARNDAKTDESVTQGSNNENS